MNPNTSIDISTIRDAITCPITHDIMTDPVTGKDGQTYERSAITQYLMIKSESPITREHMTITDLKVNPSIKFICDKYHSQDFETILQNNMSETITNSITNTITPQFEFITLNSKLSKSSNSNHFHIKFDIDKNTLPTDNELKYLSQDIILLIDRSGSMNSHVEAKDNDGNNLESGMSIQDIVNHAAKTIAKTIDKNSRLAIIAFDNEITTIIDLTPMTELNQSIVLNKIDNIRPRYQTNIWGSIQTAIEMLNNRNDKTRNSAILMFTDGQPNISPARGEVQTLKNLRINKNLYTPIYTFGFGYSLQKELLYDLSKFGGGANGHIPDGGMIATVFCNFISTILCTVFMDIKLYINTNDIELMGDYAYRFDSEKNLYIYEIGSIQIGQDRDIIIIAKNKDIEFEYYYSYVFGDKLIYSNLTKYNSKNNDNINNDNINNDNIILPHIHRYLLVESIRKIINNIRCSLKDQSIIEYNKIKHILETHRHLGELSKGMFTNLCGDDSSQGQIKLAMNDTYFNRWGEFYLDQLSRSLNQQIKPNFKDTACVFGGDIFNNIVNKASDIFDNLPPPKPSLINNINTQNNNYSYNSGPSYRSLSTSRHTISPLAMSSFNNPNGGCFMSNSKVLMSDNSLKYINMLRPGDEVWTLCNPYNSNGKIEIAKVIALVKINSCIGSKNIAKVDNLYLSPWHPIIYKNQWIYPNYFGNVEYLTCPALYNIILTNGHCINVNNIWSITLGHNYKVGILAHPYFGTNEIIKDLKKNSGWDKGLVVISDNQFIRCHITNQILGLLDQKSKIVDEDLYFCQDINYN